MSAVQRKEVEAGPLPQWKLKKERRGRKKEEVIHRVLACAPRTHASPPSQKGRGRCRNIRTSVKRRSRLVSRTAEAGRKALREIWVSVPRARRCVGDQEATHHPSPAPRPGGLSEA